VYSSLQRDLPILHAATGPDAGWIGAALKAWRTMSPGANSTADSTAAPAPVPR
jgi:hypothetical protein